MIGKIELSQKIALDFQYRNPHIQSWESISEIVKTMDKITAYVREGGLLTDLARDIFPSRPLRQTLFLEGVDKITPSYKQATQIRDLYRIWKDLIVKSSEVRKKADLLTEEIYDLHKKKNTSDYLKELEKSKARLVKSKLDLLQCESKVRSIIQSKNKLHVKDDVYMHCLLSTSPEEKALTRVIKEDLKHQRK